MSGFKKLAKNAVQEVESDFSGGLLETGVYTGTVTLAYVGQASQSKAQSLNLVIDVDGREVRDTLWVSNREGEPTYKDKRSGENRNLPGYNLANSLAQLVVSENLGDLDTDEKTVKLYDYDAKKEVPTNVEVFPDLHGETIKLAIEKRIEDKQEKNEDGKYVASGETRTSNVIHKFFDPVSGCTISEIKAYVESVGEDFDEVMEDGNLPKVMKKMPEDSDDYATKWIDRNAGKDIDKSTGGAKEGKSFKKKKKSSGAKSTLFDEDDE